MANVNISSSVAVEVELTEEEKVILQKAYAILHRIGCELWSEDGGDETETFAETSTAADCIRSFMKRDAGIDVRSTAK